MRWTPLLLLLIAAYFPLFLHLDTLTLRLWDEGRRAVNALEMSRSGAWLVPTYDYQPDLWGVKPPLLLWLQIAAMRLLGYNELAVRLPSALAGLASVLLLVWFARRWLRRPSAGYFAALILLCMPAYTGVYHSARTGDYDALLTLWLSGGLFFFLGSCLSAPGMARRRYWRLAAACVILGCLTKGIAGLFFVPGMALFALCKGPRRCLPSWREILGAALCFALIVGGYIVARERYNPGYWAAVLDLEMFGRYLGAIGEHNHDFGYYFRALWTERVGWWLLLLPFGLWAGLSGDRRARDVTLLLFINALVFMLVISNSKTKLAWYDLPVYPSLALLAALGPAFAHDAVAARLRAREPALRALFTAAFFAALFAYPYARTVERVYMPIDRGYQWEIQQHGYFIRAYPHLSDYHVLKRGYNPHRNFYVKAANARGARIRWYDPRRGLRVGERVLLCEEAEFQRIERRYAYEPEFYYDPCILARVAWVFD